MPIPAGPSSTSTTTLSAWVEECRAHIDGGQSTEANQLNGPYVAGSGTLTLEHAMGNVAAGAFLSIGGNTLRVMSVTGQVATVIAGQQGSTDANAADGALVRVNPRISDARIILAINRTLGAISAPTIGLGKILTEVVTYSDIINGYELSDDELSKVLEVRRQDSDSTLLWPRMESADWDLVRAAPTEDFPSGVAIRIRRGALPTGYDIQVAYLAVFDRIDNMSALASTTGISEQAEDVVPMGAALRLVAPMEISRNAMRSQGDSRRAQEVPAGAQANSYRGLAQFYFQRLREEDARLRAQFPLGK
jgi:hypothetical protein